jgi:hypothetical protein
LNAGSGWRIDRREMKKTLRAILHPNGGLELLDPHPVSAPTQCVVTVETAAPADGLRPVTGLVAADLSGALVLEGPTDLPADTTENPPIAEEPAAATVTEQRPAASIGARYVKDRPLGAGGLGQAWLARDRKSGERVCLKQLPPRADPSLLIQEFRAMRQLGHPGFVRIIDLDLTGFAPVLVLEHVPGPTLRQVLDRGPVLEAAAICIARGMFDAIAASHVREIVHCDLEPANVLIVLDEGGRPAPRIVDLGLSVVEPADASVNTTETGITGPAVYTAPEQLRGALLTPRSDVFALGVMLFEMLVGRPARDVELWDLSREEREWPKPLDASKGPWPVREAVARFVAACTDPDPARRPTSADAATQLRYLDDELAAPVVVVPQELAGWDAASLVPTGWFNSSGHVDGVGLDYPLAVFQSHDGYSRLRVVGSAKGGFGSWMQRFPAEQLSGRTVRLEGELSCKRVAGWGGLWLRADGVSQNLAFENMANHPLQGTQPAATHAIELTLPGDVHFLNFGVLLEGAGTLDVHALRFTVEVDGVHRPLDLGV